MRLLLPILFPLFLFGSLLDVYREALTNNSKIWQLQYEADASKERIEQVRSKFYPRIGIESYYNGEYYKRYGKQVDESYVSLGISLKQPLYKPSLHVEEAQEKLRSQSAYITHSIEKQELMKKVAEAYFKVLYAKGALALEEAYYMANKVKLDQIQTSISMGLATKIELLEATMQVNQSKAELNKQQRNKELAFLELFRLTGKKREIVRELGNLNLDFFQRFDRESFNKKLFNNLHVKQATLAKKLALKEEEKRKKEYLPTVDLRVAYSENLYQDDLFEDERHKREVRLSVTWPLYQGGFRNSRDKESILLLKASEMALEDSLKEARLLFEQMDTDMLNAIERYQILDEAKIHANLYIEAVESAYEERLKDLIDLLEAKSKRVEIQRDQLDVSYQIILLYLEMLSLVGDVDESHIIALDKAIEK